MAGENLLLRGSQGEHIRVSVKDGIMNLEQIMTGLDTDEFYVFVSDEESAPRPAPWDIREIIQFDTHSKPWWKVTRFGGSSKGEKFSGGVSEGEFSTGTWRATVDLTRAFGRIPDFVYLATVKTRKKMEDPSSYIVSQYPGTAEGSHSLEGHELQRLSVKSLMDQNADGFFDVGNPELAVSKSETDGWKDANYGLVRYYLDENAKEKSKLHVRFNPRGAQKPSHVEVFTNLNRRDYVVLEPELQNVVAGRPDKNYYQAVAMKDEDGDGWYDSELDVEKCGAYRLQVRYKFPGEKDYTYYTDHGLRRDCAVVVSPKKAMNMIVYEVNPLIAAARDSTFEGRGLISSLVDERPRSQEWPEVDKFVSFLGFKDKPPVELRMNKEFYQSLGVNMLWLQPIHPVGLAKRGLDPDTGEPWEPGSPYAVSDYWSVSPIFSDKNSEEDALTDWQKTVKKLDEWGVDVMMDGTFNHCAPDAIMGEGADLIGLSKLRGKKIADARPQWFSKKGSPREPAESPEQISDAPDRSDFPSWTDVIDFYYGSYGELTPDKPEVHPVTGMKPPSRAGFSHWNGYDFFQGHTKYTKELWEYMSNYPRYWIAKTGHPIGTPKRESHRGIDGLRCDFAQGMPAQFWEYTINKTRKLKWDFVFMAESLDGITGTPHGTPGGVGYRSSRHFDVMNESIVFYWRNHFFGYQLFPNRTPNGRYSTWWTREAYLSRDKAMDGVVLLNNLVNHDEIYPHNDPMAIAYAYAQMAALPGAPMIFYGQEYGGQNSLEHYAYTQAAFGPILPTSNFSKYERNLHKYIPNFKAYNDMVNIWGGGDLKAKEELRRFYGKVNNIRRQSPALRSGNFKFLTKWGSSYDIVDNVFAVIRCEKPYSSDGEVIIALVNNNHIANPNAMGFFSLNTGIRDKVAYSGIKVNNLYNLENLLSEPPGKLFWPAPKRGWEILSDSFSITFPIDGKHAAYYRLIDVTPAPKSAEKVKGTSESR